MTRFLSIDGVTKRFGRVTAVDRLSLEIRENEFFALLGASGSGKTTLLRMLAGSSPPLAPIRYDPHGGMLPVLDHPAVLGVQR